jgi:hypothetical protein
MEGVDIMSDRKQVPLTQQNKVEQGRFAPIDGPYLNNEAIPDEDTARQNVIDNADVVEHLDEDT